MAMALPMAFYTFYIFLIGLFNFFTRLDYTKRKEVRVSYFKGYQGEAPERVVVVGRHFDNQFEMPMLFFVTCLATYVFEATGTLAVGLAWTFVASRMIHSYIHLTSNNVIRRAIVFFFGALCVLAMWVNILFSF